MIAARNSQESQRETAAYAIAKREQCVGSLGRAGHARHRGADGALGAADMATSGVARRAGCEHGPQGRFRAEVQKFELSRFHCR